MSKHRDWDEREDSVIKELYKNGSRAVLEALIPGRKWSSIQLRASRLGISRLNYFSDRELDFILKNYGSMRSGEIGKVLGRASDVVENKAREMGLSKQAGWKKNDDEFLINNLEKLSLADIGLRLGRTTSSIYHRIQHLNLQTKTGRYSFTKLELLNFLKEKSLELKRTPLRGELFKLGLPSIQVYTKVFGSYSEACRQAGLKVNLGIVNNTKSFASDGTFCLSNAERIITEFLIQNRILFRKEVPYSELTKEKTLAGNLRCDWILENGNAVEYFGMSRQEKYSKTISRKVKLCKQFGISLISIFEKDLYKLENIFFAK